MVGGWYGFHWPSRIILHMAAVDHSMLLGAMIGRSHVLHRPDAVWSDGGHRQSLLVAAAVDVLSCFHFLAAIRSDTTIFSQSKDEDGIVNVYIVSYRPRVTTVFSIFVLSRVKPGPHSTVCTPKLFLLNPSTTDFTVDFSTRLTFRPKDWLAEATTPGSLERSQKLVVDRRKSLLSKVTNNPHQRLAFPHSAVW
jgi:hypothetical protein